jgi:uncharacterized membrane protein YdfJ with MMPL/SSD domain
MSNLQDNSTASLTQPLLSDEAALEGVLTSDTTASKATSKPAPVVVDDAQSSAASATITSTRSTTRITTDPLQAHFTRTRQATVQTRETIQDITVYEDTSFFTQSMQGLEDFIFHYSVYFLIILVLLVWPWGYISLHAFEQRTDSTFHPIPGSPSQLALEAFSNRYQTAWMDPMSQPIVILLQGKPINTTSNASTTDSYSLTDPGSPAYTAAYLFTRKLNQTLQSYCWPDLETHACRNGTWLKMTTYYSLIEEGLPILAQGLTTADGSAQVVQLNYMLPSSYYHNSKEASNMKSDKYNSDNEGNSSTADDKNNQNISSSTYNGKHYHNKKTIVRQLIQVLEDTSHNLTSPYFTVSFTGWDLFQRDLSVSAKSDARRMDHWVLPMALMLLAMALPRAHPAYVWMIPFVSVLSTVAVWSIIMRFVVNKIQITQFVPNIMMSLTLGMGIDYTLFLMSRYLEETSYANLSTEHQAFYAQAGNRREAVLTMMIRGGHVLILSGTTLMCTFLGLCVFPLPIMKAVGVGASVAIASSLFVNLTLVPALLYTPIGDYVIKKHDLCGGHGNHNSSNSISSNNDDRTESDYTEVTALVSASQQTRRPLESAAPPNRPHQFWHRLSRNWLLHPYKSVILLFLILQLLIAPVAKYATKVHTSFALDRFIPSDSPALQTYHDLVDRVGSGRLNPYQILFDGSGKNTSVVTSVSFDVMHKVIDKLMEVDHKLESSASLALQQSSGEIADNILADDCQLMTTDGLHSSLDIAATNVDAWNQCITASLSQQQESSDTVSINNDHQYSHAHRTQYNGISVFVAARACDSMIPGPCPIDYFHELNQVYKRITTNDTCTTFVTVTLGMDPLSEEGVEWLAQARKAVDALQQDGSLNGIQVSIVGYAGITTDAIHAVYRMFPTMIGVTTVVVICLMSVFFQSFFSSIRSMLSIGLTLLFSIGTSVLVHQRGVLNWTHMRALTAQDGDAICWMVPVTSFSILVGLAMDYDVFLLTRILEYRQNGYEHKSSIAAGLQSTGKIITAAGLIMSMSFGSLLKSANPVIVEWALVITVGVLLDTFVIRTLVVPIIMGLFPAEFSWWPRALPEPTICFAEFQENLTESTRDVTDLLRIMEERSEYEPLRISRRAEER